MDPVALWLLCGLALSTAFVFSQRRFIRNKASDFYFLVFLGLTLAIITIGGPIALVGFCIGSAAKALARRHLRN